jgi:hypothetical protein
VTLLLCILWFLGGMACGCVIGWRSAAYLCAVSIRSGSMRRIVEEFEEKFQEVEK